MFSSGNGKNDKAKKQNSTKLKASKSKLNNSSSNNDTTTTTTINNGHQDGFEASEESEQFLDNNKNNRFPNEQDQNHRKTDNKEQQRKKVALLAKQETIEEDHPTKQQATSCMRMFLNIIKKKKLFIPIVIILCVAAVYCIPFIDIDPRTPKSLPYIPFNFEDGPLRETSISQLKVSHLFEGQIQAAESLAFDSNGNLYMAVEGGLVLYAHLNKSSPLKRSYYDNSEPVFDSLSQKVVAPPIDPTINTDDLVKIAELNGVKLVSNSQYDNNPNNFRRRARENSGGGGGSSWRRECQLDENIYGPHLYTVTSQQQEEENEIDINNQAKNQRHSGKFRVNFAYSRCSKPLGIRLSPDENYLYVVDTLSGLYRVSLQITERPFSTQRLVTKLVDFRDQRYKLLNVIEPDDIDNTDFDSYNNNNINTELDRMLAKGRYSKNVSFIAVDDLAIDYKAGLNGGDLIYMSLASQNYGVFAFTFDLLEGKPSGAVVRYDTGSKKLTVLNPTRLARVRTSTLDLMNEPMRPLSSSHHSHHLHHQSTSINNQNNNSNNNLPDEYYLGIGAPRLDENDVFDDRPLYFANGLEIMDDKQAILIADSFNKRILKHYIRGPRKGTSDLWAWTPQHPDNIRRGYDKRHETYWVIGCSSDPNKKFDLLEILYLMPRFRKYILKNYYLFGWLIEFLGTNLFGSTSVRDFGFSLKHANTLVETLCEGMMILQYNKYGDVIRSIYSKDFPNNVKFYSQVNEIIDANNQEHALYLGSPSYRYVTKLILPTDSFVF